MSQTDVTLQYDTWTLNTINISLRLLSQLHCNMTVIGEIKIYLNTK